MAHDFVRFGKNDLDHPRILTDGRSQLDRALEVVDARADGDRAAERRGQQRRSIPAVAVAQTGEVGKTVEREVHLA